MPHRSPQSAHYLPQDWRGKFKLRQCRAFDILASALAIVVLSPLLLPVIAVLRLTGEGYILYAQERIGRGGKPFEILKFVTMLKNSPNMAGETLR